MDTTEIYKQLQKIADINDGNSELAQSLCRLAANKLEAMLISTDSRNDEKVILAAAFFANYLLVKSSFLSPDAVAQFKAGDITVSPAPERAITVAESMLCDALDCINELVRDNNFVFRRI